MVSFNKTGTAAHPQVSHEPPFLVEHLRRNVTPSGSFTPDAQLIFTRAFRTSRLLPDLPDNEARTLLAMLAFLSANGRIEGTAAQVGDLLHVSEAKALDRLRRLCRLRWHDEPITHERMREEGTITFGMSDHVVGVQPITNISEPNAPLEKYARPAESPVANRETVIAQSRTAYGRPRAEVEREVAEQLGYLTPAVGEGEGTSEANPVARRLLALGVSREQVNALLAAHDEADISDQLTWLPLRGAKNPARFIVAAIQNKYEPPARIRLERAIAAEEASKEQALPASPPGELSVGETTVLTVPDSEQPETNPPHE